MAKQMTPAELGKRAAAEKALEYVDDGMRIGLGTGSTATWFVKLLAQRIAAEGMSVSCVPTSRRTAELAESLDVPLTTLDAAGWLDITVDGADEFDADLALIKGGGGALLREKIVATASDTMIVIADAAKEVDALGAFPLPVEIVKFGWETTKSIIEDALCDVDVDGRMTTLRLNRDAPYVTDEGHLIVDLHLGRIGDPKGLAQLLNLIPGVVESGLFAGVADAVIVGEPGGAVRLLGRPPARPGDDDGEAAAAARTRPDEDLFSDL